jgi:DNA-binding NarL/FixJ family response regulator
MRSGFSGFRRGLRRILNGEDYISRNAADIIDKMENLPPARFDSTAREREVLQLLGEGKTTQETADILEISVRTVEHHKTNIFAKFGARNLIEALNASGAIEKWKP